VIVVCVLKREDKNVHKEVGGKKRVKQVEVWRENEVNEGKEKKDDEKMREL
jgi:hypothetical protein